MQSLSQSKRENGPLAPVGVVIPVFNRARTLVQTLEFVCGQTRRPHRLVIVDDGSTDDTADHVDAWLTARRPDFEWRLVRARKASAAAARDLGATYVRDLPFISFLDSDDHWPADFLERAVKSLEERPDCVLATVDRSFAVAIDEPAQPRGGSALVADPIPWIFKYGGGLVSASVLRNSAYLAAGEWPTHLKNSEDAYLFAAMALLGEWVYVPGAPVKIHLGSALEQGEEVNLSRKYADRERMWAEEYENIYRYLLERSKSISLAPLKRALARRWYLAGKGLSKQGRREEARVCYARSLQWNPWVMKTWKRRLGI